MINSDKKIQGQIESIKKEFYREKKRIRENFFKNNNGIKNSNKKYDLIDSIGKPAQCLILLKRSSSTAAINLPSINMHAEESA